MGGTGWPVRGMQDETTLQALLRDRFFPQAKEHPCSLPPFPPPAIGGGIISFISGSFPRITTRRRRLDHCHFFRVWK